MIPSGKKELFVWPLFVPFLALAVASEVDVGGVAPAMYRDETRQRYNT